MVMGSGPLPPDYTTVIDWDIANQPIYIGNARIGTPIVNPEWQIMRITWSAMPGNPTNMEWALGNDNFDKIWANRAGYAYS